MTAPRPLPRVGRVHMGQLRALTRVTWFELMRSGADPTTGARGNPILQIVLSMGFLGTVFTLNLSRFADAPTALAALFAFATGTVALVILPDTFDVRERKLEILRCKPVSGETIMASRAVALLAIAALMAGCLGLPGLVASGVRYEIPAPRVAALFGALVLGAFTGVLLWMVVALTIAVRLGVERLRMATQAVLVVLTLGVGLVSLSSLPLGILDAGGPVSFGGSAVARAWPATWFLSLALPEAGGAPGWQRPAALLLFAAALFANMALDGDRYYAGVFEARGREARRREKSLTFAAIRLAAKVPLVGPALLPPPVLAVASVVLAASVREEISRLRSLAPRLLLVLFGAIAFFQPESPIPAALLAFGGFFAAMDGWQVASQGAIPAASWVFRGAPVTPRHVMRGLVVAVVAKYFLPAAALLTAVVLRSHGVMAAAVLLAAYLLHGSVVLSLLAVVRPTLPLSRDQTATPGLGGILGTQVVGMAAGLSFTVFSAVVAFLGGWGVLVAAALLVPAAAVAAGSRLFAISRLGNVEVLT